LTDLRYNKYKKTLLTLNEGEEFCKICHGDGMIPSKRAHPGKYFSLTCKHCMGDGKIDWIEKATGKSSHLPLVNLRIEKTKLVPRIRTLKK